MKAKLFYPAICLIAVVACNNSANDNKKKEDTTVTMTGHDMHPPASGAVPALPAVPEGARVEFGNLKDNETINSPFKMKMGVEGIRIDTAGPVVSGSGHHHLLINAGDSVAAGGIIPMDAAHVHFGKGQTEYELVLPPGQYKLTLQFADGLHRSYGSKMATSVTVNVK